MKFLINRLVIFGSLAAILVASVPIESNEAIHVDIMEIDGTEIDKRDIIDLTHIKDLIYGTPENTNGDLLSQWRTGEGINPEEMGSYLEGDMLIPRIKPRNGMLLHTLRWPNKIVPYEIRGKFNANELATIQRAINQYHTKTCIKLIPRTHEKDYISFTNDNTGCWSSVGRIGGRQELNLSPGCLVQDGTTIHEIMHAIGFLHEQTRYERDLYVTINWENIAGGMNRNFDKASSVTTGAFGVPYDYTSVMHYSSMAFSKNGKPTIVPKLANGRTTMGQRIGFSNSDIAKINKMYGC